MFLNYIFDEQSLKSIVAICKRKKCDNALLLKALNDQKENRF